MSTNGEYKRPVQSVIARLMGLEEVPQRQPVQKKPRVLSENYLRRVSSIGVREKCSEHHLFRSSTEEEEESTNVLQMLETMRRTKRCVSRFKKLSKRDDVDLQNGHCEWGYDYLPKGQLCADDMKKLSRSKLKENNESCIRTGSVVRKPNLRNANSVVGCFSESIQYHDTSHLDVRKRNETLTLCSGNVYVHMHEKRKTTNGTGQIRRSRFLRQRTKNEVHCRSSKSHMEQISEVSGHHPFVKEAQLIVRSSPVLPDMKKQVHYLDESHLVRKGKKQISERWKTMKRFQQIELATRSKTLKEKLVIPDKSSKYSPSSQGGSNTGDVNFGARLCIGSCRSRNSEHARELSRPRSLLAYFNAIASTNTRTTLDPLENGGYAVDSYVAQNEKEKEFKKSSPNLAIFKSSRQYNHILQDTWMKHEGHVNEPVLAVPKSSAGSSVSVSSDDISRNDIFMSSSLNHMEHRLESRHLSFVAEGEDSPHFQDNSFEQEISNEIFEEESVCSQYSGTDPESLMSAEDAYQPSPNSVLKPLYKEEISPTSDYFKSSNASLHGLHSQLELLRSQTIEVDSDISSMMVSSDDESREGSISYYKENDDPLRSFRAEESRDFSYLVDVLLEAGFHNINMHTDPTDPNNWHSQDCPISSSIFDALEKKYGEQIFWKRSERKLLFDRINHGLVDILLPSTGVLTWKKPVAGRFSFSQKNEMIEEQLWMLLVNKEKKARTESVMFCGKDGEWLDMDDDIQVISREIENSLFDELAADISMEIFC